VRADLAALYERLPYSVEPMEARGRPEGYWLATSRVRYVLNMAEQLLALPEGTPPLDTAALPDNSSAGPRSTTRGRKATTT
jgi:hypothetical protein